MRCRTSAIFAWLSMASMTLAPAFAVAGPEDSLVEKLGEIQERYEKGSNDAKDFEIEEKEANEFLRNETLGPLPDGIESPWVRFEDSIAVVGATVDMEKIRSSLPDSMVFQLLSGRVPVEITARLSADDGVGKLDLERVLFSGVELPASLVSLMTQGEGASQFLPPGFRLGEPFPLPFDLESIHCQLGAVLMRQRPTAPPK
jgi:hypothetical protein